MEEQLETKVKKRGWHGDPDGHRNAGKRGGLIRKKQIASDPSQSYVELGKKGGEARKNQIESDPSMSYQKLGQLGGSTRKKKAYIQQA
jgi:general stress protein YciG